MSLGDLIFYGDDVLRMMIKDGHAEEMCEECGLREWNGKRIALKPAYRRFGDGDHPDNIILLCLLCHFYYEQEMTNGKITRDMIIYAKDKHDLNSFSAISEHFGISMEETKNLCMRFWDEEKYTCEDCGVKISRRSKRCRSCNGRKNIKTRSKKITSEQYRDYKIRRARGESYSSIGRSVGVSGNTIKRRMERFMTCD